MNDGQDPGTAVGVPSGDDEPMLLSTDKKDHVAEIKGPTCWNYTWKPSLASSATKSANTTDVVSIIKAGNGGFCFERNMKGELLLQQNFVQIIRNERKVIVEMEKSFFLLNYIMLKQTDGVEVFMKLDSERRPRSADETPVFQLSHPTDRRVWCFDVFRSDSELKSPTVFEFSEALFNPSWVFKSIEKGGTMLYLIKLE